MAPDLSAERFTVTLEKSTNWWGAFVIGLAGTILVVGLAGYALVALGGVAITLFIVLTSIGVFMCFCLAELAAAFPDRAGGLPAYAFETFKPLGNAVAEHIGGLSAWAYWLGWFTVAPINAYLAALYLCDLFDIPHGASYGPIFEHFAGSRQAQHVVSAAPPPLVSPQEVVRLQQCSYVLVNDCRVCPARRVKFDRPLTAEAARPRRFRICEVPTLPRTHTLRVTRHTAVPPPTSRSR